MFNIIRRIRIPKMVIANEMCRILIYSSIVIFIKGFLLLFSW